MMGGKRERTGRSGVVFVFLSVLVLLSGSVQAEAAGEKEKIMERIRQAVQTCLQKEVSGGAELTGLKVVQGVDLIDRSMHLDVDSVHVQGQSGRNRMHLGVELTEQSSGGKMSVLVEASYDIMIDVYVSTLPLARGTVLLEDHVHTVRLRNSKIPAGAILSRDGFLGKAIRSNIAEGIVIRTDHLVTQAAAKKGQRVTIILEGRSLVITSRGVLRQDAVIDGTARVLCEATKKEVVGTLTSEDTVRVEL
ncbi:MAG TPA: flagellar basal body P-ring formation chaperone FlgA [Dissulfurispiraceae bacterium]|nr:flagellar basal body P-ring formation chaperone FlgA [Dissulfurispiraceae bacterium]